MPGRIFAAVLITVTLAYSAEAQDKPDLDSFERIAGFIDLYWDAGTGRGQLGATRIVWFVRSGPKILLVEDNLDPASESTVVDATPLHHSFIRLPDEAYAPLPYDPRGGIIGLRYDTGGYADYATAIGDNINVNYGRRHRLQKKDPAAQVSEAVEPIVYYLDRGAPEPVRSALLDGARWWNQAFEAAGYKDAFQVRMLPDNADPMDVRYNVIQWVHRSTRGWSYGSSILDPRTGEILKGHVSLGSLRVRQDYLIAEGLLAPYADETVPPEMLEMSLARIRQLSAHEVGHTLGLEHNFAASTQNRASVMDYPVPRIGILDDGTLDLSDAYDDKIGAWDKRVVLYAYQDFPEGVNSDAARQKILAETMAAGFRYVADGDSRSLLVPIYLLHRFQIEAVGKLIGGAYYNYNLRGDGQAPPRPVPAARQQQAIDALIAALDPAVLRLPDDLLALISPRVPNSPKSHETFRGDTGLSFDATAPAASAVAMTLDVLLNPERAARMTKTGTPDFATLSSALLNASWHARPAEGTTGIIQRQSNMQVLYSLLRLVFDPEADTEVRAVALDAVTGLGRWLSRQSPKDPVLRVHYGFAQSEIERLQRDPAQLEFVVPVVVPPGSPIGSYHEVFY